MSKIVWDEAGKHLYETGVNQCVLYVEGASGTPYGKGVAWNGITGITESPEGADVTKLWADNIKYLNLVAAEEFKATLEAYTYPEEFEECDGSASLVKGVTIGQQDRKVFGLCYKTVLGNDLKGNSNGYKLHIVYGCTAAPSQKSYSTIDDSPEAITFSWEINTTPVDVTGFKPTATVVIDSTSIEPTKLAKLEEALYGTDSAEPYLPLPDAIKTLLA